jgi:putative ABC transport system substrate-binding protein
MRRREFIGLISGAAAWPVTARAQHPERVRHIGLLTGLAEGDSDFNDRMVALRGTLAALGWMEGRNLLIEVRFAHGRGELFPQLAKELIAQKPDVLFATSGPPAVALKSESVGVPSSSWGHLTRSVPASSAALRGLAAKSPASCSTKRALPENG